MTKKSKLIKNGASHANGSRKRKYARSTPMGRMLKRFLRSKESLAFSINRMKAWSSDDAVLASVMDNAGKALLQLEACIVSAGNLVEAGWSPPKKSLAVIYSVGDLVQISPKYRPKYRHLYSVAIMNHLVVAKILETGEVVVKPEISDGSEAVAAAAPFFVVKSHLLRRGLVKSVEKESSVIRA